jgi:hypothetical protein
MRYPKYFDASITEYGNEEMMRNLKYTNVHFYLRPTASQSKYRLTNSHNLIDSVIKTIRNLIGKASKYNPAAFGDIALMTKIVQIYNNTVHSAFKNEYTPAEVQDDFRLECEYIRECEDEVRRVDRLRTQKGLNTCETGSVLLVHIPLNKTHYSMQKRRRNFDKLAVFVKYESGNAVVDLLHTYPAVQVGKRRYPSLSSLVLSIYFTKFVASSLEEMRREYGEQFIIDPDALEKL